ncbi:16S rRNA (cytidine(1402)-2'-O)-methyltransferase [Agromyces archimandritae]|uniref:Ribosomal RNA small subunit methyltransferase I n=1 Tax=Agromyces archimandritae TaxID=2781962 RepID=A0A975FM97_9MICO|nr:16S rRNA (cytidine(1402)-2'-O)-methyltransferase [Agromyces archimandritae]QTX04093.1 16S rRNA (cytidine(1402)-2'-O)-methyltransferase [Agromyces archimandritae]
MIILAATPIGNLGDASARLRETLETASTVAAEDTRVAQRLFAGLGIANRPKLIALHEHNERQKAAELAEFARDADLVVLTDAGMPTVSDPGFPLVSAAVDAGVEVTVVPGPSAPVTALAVSGLPSDRFAFEGFLPRKAGDRARRLAGLAADERPLIFFEAPSRLAASLADLATAFGADRRAAVCRELTKLHEEVRRGTLAELAEWAAGGVRGEICIVVHGAPPPVADADAALGRVLELVDGGERLKDAAARVAGDTGLSRRELYEAALAARRER